MVSNTHNQVKSVQQAITSVLSKRAERGAPVENLEAYKVEMLHKWGHDKNMEKFLLKLDVKQFVK